MKTIQCLISLFIVCVIMGGSYGIIAKDIQKEDRNVSIQGKQGWIADGNHWSYYGEDSELVKGVHKINDKIEWFDQSGVWKQSLMFNQWMSGYENVDKKMNDVLSNIIQKQMNDEEKMNAMKEWIINHMNYENVSMNTSQLGKYETNYQNIGISQRDIYGAYALLNGKGVCTHYAELFKMMANSVGLKTMTLTGYWRNQSHAWNATYINNQWIYSDLTMVDSNIIHANSYFLMKTLDSDYQNDSFVSYQQNASYQNYDELHQFTGIEIIHDKTDLIQTIIKKRMENKKEIIIFYTGDPLTLKRNELIQTINSGKSLISDIQIKANDTPYILLNNIYRGKVYILEFIPYNDLNIEWMERYGDMSENSLHFNR